MSKLFCCHVGNPRHPAALEITDQGEQNPELMITHSCYKHLSDMIGSVDPTKPVGPWIVRILTDDEKNQSWRRAHAAGKETHCD